MGTKYLYWYPTGWFISPFTKILQQVIKSLGDLGVE